MADQTPIVRIRGLTKTFRAAGRDIHALNGVDLSVAPAETLGIVGESGSGKSTIGRILAGLETATSGEVLVNGKPPRRLSARADGSGVQMIFQDPYASLNPRLRIGAQLHETLRGTGRSDRADTLARGAELMQQVGLPADALDRFPHEFSGGQRQRIAIARAISTDPAVIVADEPVSALDVSIRGQILDLMRQLKGRTAYLFISHDMAAVANICDRVLVLHRGQVVEQGPTAQVIAHPRHDYTRALLDAVPRIGRRRIGTGATPVETPVETPD